MYAHRPAGGLLRGHPGAPSAAAAAAVAAVDLAGERAEERRVRYGTGNATFRTDLIDAVFNLTEDELKKRSVRYEIYQG